MIQYDPKDRIPTVSLFKALEDMVGAFKNGAQISFLEARMISQKEYKEYLNWLGLEKFTDIKFVVDTQESQKVNIYQFNPKIKKMASLDQGFYNGCCKID